MQVQCAGIRIMLHVLPQHRVAGASQLLQLQCTSRAHKEYQTQAWQCNEDGCFGSREEYLCSKLSTCAASRCSTIRRHSLGYIVEVPMFRR